MSTVLGEARLAGVERGRWRPWLALLVGLLVLYVPTYLGLARTLWREDEYAHGPIMLAVFAYLVWRSRHVLLEDSKRWPVAGTALFVLGLLLYGVGRSQSLPLFEVLSHFPVLAGVLLMMRGPRALRSFGFAFFFLLFFVPLPGFVLESIAIPLKALVSSLVESILALAGYPIERQGVTLLLGDHEMLVADACSGLNSLYSLTALTLLYTHLTGPSARSRWAILLAAMMPIAILANVARVTFLVLVAYHYGDAAAQGFVHSFAGMLVFVTAFALLLAVDRFLRREKATNARELEAPQFTRNSYPSLATAAFAAILMLGAALAAPQLKPVRAEGQPLDLQVLVPQAFGDWSIDPTIVPIPPTAEVQEKLDRIYSQTVSRAYANARGEQMMLTIAYGGDQSDALKAHRQEVCYTAQGFSIHGLEQGELSAAGRAIPVTRMLAVRGDRSEPVTYWFTMGDRVVRGRAERLQVQLASGLRGRIPDGMLVRVSSISTDPSAAFAAQESFIASLLGAIPAAEASRVAGAARP
ncbi:MAG: exosortase B [Usitatibacter sp.]